MALQMLFQLHTNALVALPVGRDCLLEEKKVIYNNDT